MALAARPNRYPHKRAWLRGVVDIPIEESSVYVVHNVIHCGVIRRLRRSDRGLPRIPPDSHANQYPGCTGRHSRMPRGCSAWTRRTIRAVNYRVALFVRVPERS